MIIFEKVEELSDISDRRLTRLVKIYKNNDKRAIEEDTSYKGHVISFDELSDLMQRLKDIKQEVEESGKDLLSRKPETLAYRSVPASIRELLEFLKEIDNDLYLETLGIFVGIKNKSVDIYSKYDKKAKENGIDSRSMRDGRTFIVLDKEIDRKTAKKLSDYVQSDKCSILENVIMAHEVAHGFDYTPMGIKQTKDGIESTLPSATHYYLAETTPIFF